MSQRPPRNVPASVRTRLLNEAKASGDSFDQVLQYFAIERFLYRLSQTPWSERFIVKGAVMLRAWDGSRSRPTRDIDVLGRVDNSPETIERAVRECLSIECPDDGLVFYPEIETTVITTERAYPGVRAVVRGDLDGAVFKLQVDIGIDDAVVPDPVWIDYPTLLDLTSPRIRVYHPVTAIAEKFETIVNRGAANSRLRDYFDIWALSRSRTISGLELRSAIAATFAHRKTPLPAEVPPGLGAGFYADHETQKRWRSFLKTKRLDAPDSLADVCEAIVIFVMPPVIAAASGEQFTATWDPSKGWS